MSPALTTNPLFISRFFHFELSANRLNFIGVQRRFLKGYASKQPKTAPKQTKPTHGDYALQISENGFTPLPADGKAVKLKDWPHFLMPSDEEEKIKFIETNRHKNIDRSPCSYRQSIMTTLKKHLLCVNWFLHLWLPRTRPERGYFP